MNFQSCRMSGNFLFFLFFQVIRGCLLEFIMHWPFELLALWKTVLSICFLIHTGNLDSITEGQQLFWSFQPAWGFQASLGVITVDHLDNFIFLYLFGTCPCSGGER